MPRRTIEETFHHGPAVLWISEPGKGLSYVSDRWSSLSGQRLNEALGEGWLDRIHSSDVDSVINEFKRANFAKDEIDVRFRIRQGDTSYIWARAQGAPIKNEQGEFIGFSGSMVDESDQMEALHKMENILENIQESYMLVGSDWKVQQVNKKYEEISGKNREEVLGENALDLFKTCSHAADKDYAKFAIRAMEERKHIHYEAYMPDSNRFFSIDIYPAQDGGIAFFTRDETELKLVRQDLKGSRLKLQEYVEAMPQMAFIADAKGNIIFYNKRHYSYFGLDKNDEEGWAWTEQNMHHPEDVEKTIERWTHSLQTGEPYEIEYRLRRRDGEYRWHLGRAMPLTNRNGEIVEWFGTNTDIHEAKLSQEKLEEALSIRDEFLSIASHELKTPITSLNLQNEIMELLLAGEKVDKTEMFETLDSYKEQTRRLENLVDGLLDINKIQAGRMDFHFAPFDLRSLVMSVGKKFGLEFKKSGTDFNIDMPSDLIVNWDFDRIEQVLINLTSNVLKYAPGADVQVSASVVDGDRARIVFADNGPGISEERLPKIFNRFERAASSKKISGLGLGLYIVKSIIEAHGGSISAYNQDSGGAMFKLELPLSPKEES